VVFVLVMDVLMAGAGAVLIGRSLAQVPAAPLPAVAPAPLVAAPAAPQNAAPPTARRPAPAPAPVLAAPAPAHTGGLPSRPPDPGVMRGPLVPVIAAPVTAGPDAAAAPPAPPDAPAPVAIATAEAPDAPAVDHTWVRQMTAGIRQVVDDHRGPILDCYRRAAKAQGAADPLRGRVEVHLTIQPAGDADDVRVVKDETGSEALGVCLVELMKTWRYPAPGAEAMEFVWPFTFQGQR
jgi:TonB family protein